MTRESKLKMIGLDKEAYELRKAGNTWADGNRIIHERHGKEIVNKFGEPVSDMGFKRAVIEYEKGLITKSLDDGLDPVKEMDRQFREAVVRCNKKNQKLEKKADEILERALKDGSITDQTRALKEVRDTISQELKNFVLLQQNGIRQVTNIGEVNFKNQQDVKILLVNFSDELMKIYDELCDDCKQKVDIERLINKLV